MAWIDQHIGRAVRARREALAMTQDELAAAIRIPTEALARQEAGTMSISPPQLKELTQALGVDVSFFFETAIASVEKRPPRPDAGLHPNDDGFLLSLLMCLHRLMQGCGIDRNDYLGQTIHEVQRALRPDTIDRHVGDRIQHRRREVGMQREALAKAVGITDDELRHYEDGTKRLTFGLLRAVCEALKVDLEYVYATMDVEAPSPKRSA